MNYHTWGNEYLQEAENLRRCILRYRHKLQNARQEEVYKAGRELRMLIDMYTECVQTGCYLQQKEEPCDRDTNIANALRMIYNESDQTYG